MWKPTMEGSQRHHFREFRNKSGVPLRGRAHLRHNYGAMLISHPGLKSLSLKASLKIYAALAAREGWLNTLPPLFYVGTTMNFNGDMY